MTQPNPQPILVRPPTQRIGNTSTLLAAASTPELTQMQGGTNPLRVQAHHGRAWSPGLRTSAGAVFNAQPPRSSSFSISAAASSMTAAAGGSASGLTQEFILSNALRFGTWGTLPAYYLGPKVMPRLTADRWRQGFPEWGTEHLEVVDSKRGLSQPRRRVHHVATVREFNMALFGLATAVNDLLVGRISDSIFEITRMHLEQVQRAMELDAEFYRREVLDPANFDPGHVKDLSGTPVNGVGGSIRAEFLERVNIVIGKFPELDRSNFAMVLSDAAWRAVEQDTTLLGERAATERAADFITMSDVARHIGIPESQVMVGDATALSDAGLAESMWGDIAYIFPLMSTLDQARVDNTFGGPVAAFERVMPIDVFPSWREPETDSTVWPVDRGALQVLNNSELFGVLTNLGG